MRELICTSCGKTIQVPEELETFSCVYCGAKLSLADFLPAQTAESDASIEADRAFALEHLIDAIRDYPRYGLKNFTKKNYETSFRTYEREISPTYEAMDRCLTAGGKDRDALLEEFTDRFLSDWEAMHGKRLSGGEAESNKITLALYLVPAILDLELSCGRDYVELLHRKFVGRYPKNIFRPGTYEEISAGFSRRKLCFITTAICEFEGKPDDCAELAAFRAFRDGWLTAHGGQALIEEYYDCAPAIVTAIDYCDDRAARYAALRRDYLSPCYAALQHGDPETCKDRYITMVRSLKAQYFS